MARVGPQELTSPKTVTRISVRLGMSTRTRIAKGRGVLPNQGNHSGLLKLWGVPSNHVWPPSGSTSLRNAREHELSPRNLYPRVVVAIEWRSISEPFGERADQIGRTLETYEKYDGLRLSSLGYVGTPITPQS
jgi:hypothetical protein